MTLELTKTPSDEAKEYIEKWLFDISEQDRELYSRQEIEDMLLDIYSLLNKK
jgi:hypothetical protein